MILLDTTILSIVLRRRLLTPATREVRAALSRLVVTNTALGIPGIVFQEVLSGVRTETQFAELRGGLETFRVVLAEKEDHLRAAALFNTCRRRGITATPADCLIAAQAISSGATLWTLDHDFERIARASGLKLYTP